jgi:hypothetical protein
MGDRANIHVRENDKDTGVYLYTHHGGTEAPKTLQDALSKRLRWDDCQYLTRIIFCQMVKVDIDGETGFGISAFLGDGASRVLRVNTENKTVSFEDRVWTFEEYLRIDAESIWEHGQ